MPLYRKPNQPDLEAEIAELENAESVVQEEERVAAIIPETKEEETFKKRYGDLRRHAAAKEKEYQDRLTKLERDLETATKKQLKFPKQATEEDVEEWINNYPDVAAIVGKMYEMQSDNRSRAVEEDTDRIAKLEDQLIRREAYAALLDRHPDFPAIANSQDFKDWLATKSQRVIDSIEVNYTDVDSADETIQWYKDTRKEEKPAKRESKKNAVDPKLAAMDIPSGRTSNPSDKAKIVFSESMVQSMTNYEYDQYEDEINAQIHSGEFIYDVSRGK